MLAAEDEAAVRAILCRHRDDLADQGRAVTRKAAAVTRYIEKGITVPSAPGFRPVAINVGVRDLREAIRFYETVFDTTFETDEVDGEPVHARLWFGRDESFFMFNLRVRGEREPHRDHISAFGFVVDDLDDAHRRAVAAGAVEHVAPVEEEGMPRHSRFQDPSGNRVVLWQG